MIQDKVEEYGQCDGEVTLYFASMPSGERGCTSSSSNAFLSTQECVAGAASVALGLVEEWLTASGLPDKKPEYVPSWIDALLLILDQGIRIQPPANVQAAKVSHTSP